jgi:hypothetical protein
MRYPQADTLGTGGERRQPVLSHVVPLAAAPLARYRGSH